MINYTKGNLLEANVDALVNTVNTVGVMGKGIALMFKEQFPKNYLHYQEACARAEVEVGKMFVTSLDSLVGPKFIINFPTKQHWRSNSRMEWIEAGLHDLKQAIQKYDIHSIAIPPLGAGNGGLDWIEVRQKIEAELGSVEGVDILVYEPTTKYQNVAKSAGADALTPARALIAELIRRYSVLGIECSILEAQKLAWFAERALKQMALKNVLNLNFEANRFGPYANRLDHLLNHLDGTYLKTEKRIADAKPSDRIWFVDAKRDEVSKYVDSAAFAPYAEALDCTSRVIDGFESPFGMELLATVDWLISEESVPPRAESIRDALGSWPKGGDRKLGLFDHQNISIAIERLNNSGTYSAPARLV